MKLKNLMSLSNKYHLCDNCYHQKDCIFKKQAKMPIIQCEEYEVETKNGILSISDTLIPQTTEIQNETFYGLCQNCDFKTNCALRTDGVIIINCKHYQ